MTEAKKEELAETFESITHAFHVRMKDRPGHSIIWHSCWTCQMAAYAAVVPPRRQSEEGFAEALKVLRGMREREKVGLRT
jgi:hypothetical protein